MRALGSSARSGGSDEAAVPKVWYRTYILTVLLFVSIANLATRNQPSYLITVPVPQCVAICEGVTTYPTCNKEPPKNASNIKTKEDRCDACRLQPATFPSASPKIPPLDDLPPFDKDAVFVAELKHRHLPTMLDVETLHAELARPDHKDISVKRETVPIASYYSMADGTCLWYWEYGLLIGYGFALVYAAGMVPAGYMCDRQSRIQIVAISLFVWSVCTSMQASSHGFWMLLLWRAVIGLAQAFCAPALVALTADYFASSERQRDAALAIVTMIGPQLGAGCASFSIIFAEMMGWRWVVLLTGVIGILLSALLLATVQEPVRTEWSAPCATSLVVEEVFEKSRVARSLILAVTAKMFGSYSLAAFLPIWYARRALTGYTITEYGTLNALAICLAGVLAPLLGMLLSQVFGRRDSRAACIIGFLGALACLPLLFVMLLTNRFETSLFCYFAVMVLGDCWFGPTMETFSMYVRPSVRGQATSLLLGVATLGGNLGPALVGFVDPGNANIGLHLLWISLTAQMAAALSFFWTAREIGLFPAPAVGRGPSPALSEKMP